MVLFYGAQLKIDRAKKHIADLRTGFDAFLDANPHTHAVEADPDPGSGLGFKNLRIEILFKSGACIPDTFGLIIGDAAHNLRSALDHLIWELVGIDGGTQNRHLSFPMGDTRQNYESTVNGLDTPRVDTKKFLCGFEAFAAGNGKALYGIHRLDNADKHCVITPIIAAARIVGLTHGPTGTIYGDAIPTINEDGKAVLSISRHTDHSNIKVALDVFFGKVDVFPGEPALPTLTEIAQHVIDIREAFVAFVTNRP